MAYTPYQKYDWQVGDEISESKLDHIEGGLEDASNQIPLKADAVGEHSDLGSGYTTTLKPTKYNKDEQPYLFRKALGARLTSEKIVGGTVAWNQQIKDGNFETGANWIKSNPNVTFTVSGNVGTIVVSNAWSGIYQNLSDTPKGHKYLLSHTIKSSLATLVYFRGRDNVGQRYLYNNGTTTYSEFTTVTKIINVEHEGMTDITFGIQTTVSDEENTIQLKNVILIDLTLAFGTTIANYIYALEQATAGAGVAFLRNNGFMTKDYYPFNAGELMSVLTSGHRTVGKNQANLAVYKQGYVLGSDGAESANSTYCITEAFPVLGGSDYSGSFVRVKGDDVLRIGFYDGNMNFISRPTFTDNHRLETAPANARYARLSYRNVEPDMANIQVEIGSAITEYEPYSEHLYPLSPVSLRGIMTLEDGKLKNDGDEYYPDGTVKRRYSEELDLGTLDWRYNTSPVNYFAADCPNKQIGFVNMICSKYPTSNSLSISEQANKTIRGGLSGNTIFIVDSSYTDAAAFKAAMSGVYLVYELATPTIETTDPYQSEQTCSEYGTEAFIDERDVPIPVGHVTKYWPDLVAKIEGLPDVTAIAPTENGSTASQAYSVGQYFFRNGEFCKAKTNIASGATFTLNTNYEVTTIAAELYAALNS